jgi:predicted RNase H-like nuclease (RuvC/YqgF family)
MEYDKEKAIEEYHEKRAKEFNNKIYKMVLENNDNDEIKMLINKINELENKLEEEKNKFYKLNEYVRELEEENKNLIINVGNYKIRRNKEGWEK